MTIIAITDIHGRLNMSNAVADKIRNVDLVLIAGDITHFGNEEDANAVIRKIQQLNSAILAVPGNCDRQSVNNMLKTENINLHGEMRVIDKIAFFGLGGSNKSPLNTPQEYSESQIAAVLTKFQKREAHFHIFVSHPPPAKTKLDKIFLGFHVGSKSVRTFIEQFVPDLVICGHIHEARGTDKIGKTTLINPGPFPEHYAVIDVEDKLIYQLY
jgi:Icc-related predicted phosphoesterase